MDQWVVELVVSVVLGAIVGGLGRILLPGAQRISVLMTIVVGIFAVYMGHFIAEQFAWGQYDGSFPNWPKIAIQVVLAMIVLGLIGGVGRRN